MRGLAHEFPFSGELTEDDSSLSIRREQYSLIKEKYFKSHEEPYQNPSTTHGICLAYGVFPIPCCLIILGCCPRGRLLSDEDAKPSPWILTVGTSNPALPFA